MDATADSTALTLAITSGFLLFAGGFWIIVSMGNWALAPVEHRVIKLRVPTQFSLREFALLAIEMQLAVGIVFWWCGESTAVLSVLAVIGSALLIAWWHGAKRLARCDVTCPLRRGLFLAVVIPLATTSIAAALWINGQAVTETCLARHWPLKPWLAGNLVIIGAFTTCRLLTVWTMRNVTPRPVGQVPEDGIQYVS